MKFKNIKPTANPPPLPNFLAKFTFIIIESIGAVTKFTNGIIASKSNHGFIPQI